MRPHVISLIVCALATPGHASDQWWSLKPLRRPELPRVKATATSVVNPIDAFVLAKLEANGLGFSPQADAGTLCRRLYFDLIGLPPTPDEVDAFVADSTLDPDVAFENLVDKLLASPQYGERWARHWLDVVHFGETHGYDKDKPRPNAWPYRDYVIEAFNNDKPYPRFVQDQVAGDVLFPSTADGIIALGFLAAGPWDFIGHVEVPETKIDGQIARHLDRDDMVSTTFNTFCSLTVHCAQCHDHKFDPIRQRDYYRLQSVFAALDRADRNYDIDPAVALRRAAIETKRAALAPARSRDARPEFGWHSAISATPNAEKWVQIDLGETKSIQKISLHPCHDDFGGIGDGFGFPVRFKIEVSNDATFRSSGTVVGDRTQANVPNPGLRPVEFAATECRGRYVRVTATKLATRTADYIYALAEVRVIGPDGKNAAAGAAVSAFDSIEAPPRWARTNLTDGWYPAGASPEDGPLRDQLASLPPPHVVYSAGVYNGNGSFRGTGPDGGRPRKIHILQRGDVHNPLEEVGPGTVPLLPDETGIFNVPSDAPEGERRAALARWLTDSRHPLLWRSIVNRVWQGHFTHGIVETPNDFGKMGSLPTHPELLDWLAVWFRDDAHGSLKALHRLLVTSRTYRQTSNVESLNRSIVERIDPDNRLLWRQHRRKLEAEAIRDGILEAAGKLDLTMGGPSFQDFVIDKPEHSPHYEYELADIENPQLHRRSIYRFLVRSRPQPFMSALDCADPSMLVDRRNETLTPLQALAQLNNQLVIAMAKHFASRVEKEGGTTNDKVARAFRIALSRPPTANEQKALSIYADEHGLPNTCRLILNLNEFVFVD